MFKKKGLMNYVLLIVSVFVLAFGATVVFASEAELTMDSKVKNVEVIQSKVESGILTEEEADAIVVDDKVKDKAKFSKGKITPEMLEWKVEHGYLTREQADSVLDGSADIGDYLPKYKDKFKDK